MLECEPLENSFRKTFENLLKLLNPYEEDNNSGNVRINITLRS